MYECSDCKEVVEIFHSIFDERKNCDICGAENTLNKIPEVPAYVKKRTAGKVVQQHIEEAKRQVQEDKKNMTKDYEV